MGTVVSFEEKRRQRILAELEELNPSPSYRVDLTKLSPVSQYKAQLAYCSERLIRLKTKCTGPYKTPPDDVVREIEILEAAIKLLQFYIKVVEA